MGSRRLLVAVTGVGAGSGFSGNSAGFTERVDASASGLGVQVSTRPVAVGGWSGPVTASSSVAGVSASVVVSVVPAGTASVPAVVGAPVGWVERAGVTSSGGVVSRVFTRTVAASDPPDGACDVGGDHVRVAGGVGAC